MFFVRTAVEADLPKVSALLGAAWHQTYDRMIGAGAVAAVTAAWHSVPALKTRLAMPASEFVVADDGRQIGGMGFASMDPKAKGKVALHMLYVAPALQRQGIGRDLFAELETCFPDADRMALDVALDNGDAIRFYERLGFAGGAEHDATLPGGVTLRHLAMEKPLEF